MELQIALAILGYPVGGLDGILGPRTTTAWAEFKTDVHTGDPDMIGPESVEVLDAMTRPRTYDLSTRASTIKSIGAECIKQGIGLNTQSAYVLATVQWETNNRFAPVKEAYWEDEDWRKAHFRYYPYYGRGYVQLTWKSNYEFYGTLLGLNLVAAPDLALQPQAALFILVHGFKTGAFTGRRITDYIDAKHTDFVNARRCINGLDKANEIASLAEAYLHGSITATSP
jgi:hypothetical protein